MLLHGWDRTHLSTLKLPSVTVGMLCTKLPGLLLLLPMIGLRTSMVLCDSWALWHSQHSLHPGKSAITFYPVGSRVVALTISPEHSSPIISVTPGSGGYFPYLYKTSALFTAVAFTLIKHSCSDSITGIDTELLMKSSELLRFTTIAFIRVVKVREAKLFLII